MPIRRLSKDSADRELAVIEHEEAMSRPLPDDTFKLMGADTDAKVRTLGYRVAAAPGGVRPNEMAVQDMLRLVKCCDNACDIEKRYRDRVRSPLTAIRAWCVTQCQCGAIKAVTDCSATYCPLWPFRMGTNPFFGKFKEDATREDNG